MMFKLILIFLLFTSLLIARSFNFSEIRYSDAIGRSFEFHGKITFAHDALLINYNNDEKILDYQNGVLVYMENMKQVEISQEQKQEIIQYFEIIMMLYKGENASLLNEFEIEKTDNLSILKPKGSLKNFIEKIVLLQDKEAPKEIKLFLKNSDTITIRIEDEIH